MEAVAGPTAATASIDAATIQRDRLVTLGRLTAGIAHELNNPIGFIASNLNTLGRYATVLTTLLDSVAAELPADRQEVWKSRLATARWEYLRADLPALVDETRQGAEQLKQVVAELKGLCRNNAKAEATALDGCVHAALTVIAHAIKRRAVVTLDLAAPMPVLLVRAQIVQLVINLVVNAVEAFGERPLGDNLIRITTLADDDGVGLVIEDNGPGIPAHQQAQIFDAFMTTKHHGTGLGLPISKRIVDDHGGRIDYADSVELGGARFTVRLCAWQPQAAPP